MISNENSSDKRSKTIAVPRRLLPIIYVIGAASGHILLPWIISLMTARYGWNDSRPGIFNVLALIPVLLGMAGMIWGLVLHYVSAPDIADWGFAPNYLILKGPYRYSRNPMYVSEILLWLGWAAFYGGMAVLIATAIFWVFLNFYGIPHEERALESRFGQTYLQYKHTVPRWIGRIRP